jgi:hypothetical protein
MELANSSPVTTLKTHGVSIAHVILAVISFIGDFERGFWAIF